MAPFLEREPAARIPRVSSAPQSRLANLTVRKPQSRPSQPEIPGAKRRKADQPPRLMARKAKRTAVRAGAGGQAKWWAWEDLNFRPHAYQARALTN